MTAPDLVDRLAAHKTLGRAPREELTWLASHGSLRHMHTGEVLSAKGVQIEGLFVVLSGRIAIFVDRGAGLHKIMEWREGDVTGLLPYSRLVSPPGDTVAQEPSTLLTIQRDHLGEMIRECDEVTTILVHTMLDRARAFTSSDLHDEKMISLGKLSAGLAHELNNPASARAVDGPALNAVLRWAAAGCSVRGLASEIQEAATRISGLVLAIKGFTHMDQATVAEPVDLAQSLSNTVAVLKAKARSKAAAVIVNLEPDLPRVLGFVGELNQIWANLIDNALDAIPDSGRVEVLANRDHQRVVVLIVDNGTGIPDEMRERIFDPFFTTKPVGHGTGLGLDIVRRLVRHNDGDITVESRPGRTEFRVVLPMVEFGSDGVEP